MEGGRGEARQALPRLLLAEMLTEGTPKATKEKHSRTSAQPTRP